MNRRTLSRAAIVALALAAAVAVTLIILTQFVWGPCELDPRNC